MNDIPDYTQIDQSAAMEDLVSRMAMLKEILQRSAIEQIEDHPILHRRVLSILPRALVLGKAAKQKIDNKTYVLLEFKTRDGRRATYLSIPLVQWYGRTVHFGDPCKNAIREAKRTLYRRQRGTWGERTRFADTWAPMTEGGW